VYSVAASLYTSINKRIGEQRMKDNDTGKLSDFSLYDLSVDTTNLLEQVEELAELGIADKGELIESITNELQTKTDSCVSYLDMLADKIELADKKMKYFKEIKTSLEARESNLMEYIKTCMKMSDKSVLKGNLRSIKLRKPSQIINIINENDIPSKFKTITQKVNIDKKALKDVLKQGELIEGAELSEGKQSLIIK